MIAAAIFVAPLVLWPLLTLTSSATRGLPFPVAVAITASMIALPLVALIWVWGRRTR